MSSSKSQIKREARIRRHVRIRHKVSGSAMRPRLAVFRSTEHIYAQLIDDEKGHTIASASTIDGEVKKMAAGKTKTEEAKIVGQMVAARAKNLGVSKIVFDRGGNRYQGRIKALADAAREAGLEF
jgi:large subunit ribosomal protein L18